MYKLIFIKSETESIQELNAREIATSEEFQKAILQKKWSPNDALAAKNYRTKKGKIETILDAELQHMSLTLSAPILIQVNSAWRPGIEVDLICILRPNGSQDQMCLVPLLQRKFDPQSVLVWPWMR